MPATLMQVAAKSAVGPTSAVARAAGYVPEVERNVSDLERWVSLGAGAALLANGALGRNLNVLSLLAGGYLVYRASTGNCPLYQAMGCGTAGPSGPNAAVEAGAGVKVEHAVTVNAPADRVYRFWRNLSQLPQFMSHLRQVTETDATHSRWTAHGPLGLSVQWEAEIIEDKPNRMIAWKSLPGSDVDTAGSVHFDAAAGGGTEVRVSLKYDPPAGKFGVLVARLFGEAPEQQVRDDLARFKQIMESGAAPTAGGQSPAGKA